MKPPQVSVYRTLVLIDCGYSLEPRRRGGSNVYPQSMFCAKVYPLEPHFYIEQNGGCRGLPIFLIFAPKHRLWVLVRTASARRF